MRRWQGEAGWWQDTGRTAEEFEGGQGDCEAVRTTRNEGGRDQEDRVFILVGRRSRRQRLPGGLS